MGAGIAKRLLATGFELSVYNRSRAKAEIFSGKAQIEDSPAKLGKKCDLVFTVVTDSTALQDILLGPDGVINSGNQKLVLADISTISPAQSMSFALALREQGIEMLGVPVMGGPSAAESGELVPIVAGSRSAFECAEPTIRVLGKTVFYLGDKDGAANVVKLALNLNIALIASAVAEGITFVRAAAVDPSIFIQILNSTYFKTGLSEKKGPKMVSGSFEPSFHLKNMLKDLELASNTALAEKITLPQTVIAQQMFRAASNMGYSEKDYTAICAFLAKINGLDIQ
jgi:3-hydroxyisobutyrate dehydrogenase